MYRRGKHLTSDVLVHWFKLWWLLSLSRLTIWHLLHFTR